ncbi:MAG: RnfABCDGE type electron transport complex subunit D [Ruminococcaceae bacterium]|nr:RnfABCDGE type electron transport complex subunit D [Oscillospiraceae bacterium]
MDFLKVTSSPHMRHEDSTRIIMLDVLIALCPALIWAVIVFGARALILTLVSVASCVLFEFLYRLIMKKPCSVGDLSAAVTGVLLAFCLPVSVPIWLPVVGSFFAIVIVKQLYGGIGKNVVNPALAARVFLFLAYPDKLGGSAFTIPKASLPLFGNVNLTPDVVASATPLANLSEGAAPTEDIFTLFLGERAGCIGEVSILMILAGALYLLVRKIITWHIPVAYIVTVAVVSYIFPASGMDAVQYVLCELCSGGLMLGAFFMATDYTTSPVSAKGRIIYGIGCGLITMFVRNCGGYPEGVSFAILIMNCLAWYIDKFTRPRVFGGAKKNVKK